MNSGLFEALAVQKLVLTVILALTLWVLWEQWAPAGERTATASGIGLLVVALWMATR